MMIRSQLQAKHKKDTSRHSVNTYVIRNKRIYVICRRNKKNTRKNLPSDLLPSDLRGHTTYKAPTLATAISSTTSVKAPPKRQSTVLCDYYITNSKDLPRGKFAADPNTLHTLLNYLTANGLLNQEEILWRIQTPHPPY